MTQEFTPFGLVRNKRAASYCCHRSRRGRSKRSRYTENGCTRSWQRAFAEERGNRGGRQSGNGARPEGHLAFAVAEGAKRERMGERQGASRAETLAGAAFLHRAPLYPGAESARSRASAPHSQRCGSSCESSWWCFMDLLRLLWLARDKLDTGHDLQPWCIENQ
jgi:hypothetical protein